MLSLLSPAVGSTVVDLGAGYGRMGFVLSRHYPDVSFVGYEIVEERVSEAKRCLEHHGCQNSEMLCEDLSAKEFQPTSADFYFIYDYGSRIAISKTLNDLRTIARSHPIVVVGRGRLSRDLIEQENPWLSGVNAPEHHGNFSIYRS
jgi:precorrin-6B methylase 2